MNKLYKNRVKQEIVINPLNLITIIKRLKNYLTT